MPWVPFQTAESPLPDLGFLPVRAHVARVLNPEDKPVKDVRTAASDGNLIQKRVSPSSVAYEAGYVILVFAEPLVGEVAL